MPGPLRELVIALHGIYALAGKPSTRTISETIRERDDLDSTLSHEGVSALLRGDGVPRWANLESLVRVLVDAQRVGERNMDVTVRRIHALWCLADGAPPPPESAHPPPPGRPPASTEDAGESGAPALAPVMSWNPRRRTLDVFDRRLAVEIIKEVGGTDEQS
ncbi:hypothetical protein [Streptomyces erythrochromogenes]|uniref:hypothetical protein n=1 Tax=Streptomyces erythrochromogenes TaxID=285574 RepID=UPI0038640751|nr:hypothetical protein OG489_03880 [Streptomyces erythrochromogenes]